MSQPLNDLLLLTENTPGSLELGEIRNLLTGSTTDDSPTRILEELSNLKNKLIESVDSSIEDKELRDSIKTFIHRVVLSIYIKYQNPEGITIINPNNTTHLFKDNGFTLLRYLDYLSLVLLSLYVSKLTTADPGNIITSSEIVINSFTYSFLSNHPVKRRLQNEPELANVISSLMIGEYESSPIVLKFQLAIAKALTEPFSDGYVNLMTAQGIYYFNGITMANAFINQKNITLPNIQSATLINIMQMYQNLRINMLRELSDASIQAAHDDSVDIFEITKEKSVQAIKEYSVQLRNILKEDDFIEQSSFDDATLNRIELAVNAELLKILADSGGFGNANTPEVGDLIGNVMGIFTLLLSLINS